MDELMVRTVLDKTRRLQSNGEGRNAGSGQWMEKKKNETMKTPQ
jgi:hypothetical protein